MFLWSIRANPAPYSSRPRRSRRFWTKKMYLPDINVWLALTFDSHVHHPSAKMWFDGLTNNAFCLFRRLTQQGFLRLATNPSVFGKDAVPLPKAWQLYDTL